MQYIRLGETGLVVSRLAFGSMTFGSAAGPFTSVYKVDQAGADALVARAIDTGINFFNSADVYAGGESERILGKAIGTKRKEVVIATKVGNRMGPALVETGLSRRHILEAVNGSLTRLGTDYIDVYLVHKVDAITPVEETIEALEDVVRQGKVRYVGFSNWPAWMAAKAVGIQRARGWSQFAPPRCTTPCSAAISNTSSCHSAPMLASASWCGARWPEVSSAASTHVRSHRVKASIVCRGSTSSLTIANVRSI